MMDYGCPRCGSAAAMEDFEARPVFGGEEEVEVLELVVESWCDSCDAGSIFTDEITIDDFIDKLQNID